MASEWPIATFSNKRYEVIDHDFSRGNTKITEGPSSAAGLAACAKSEVCVQNLFGNVTVYQADKIDTDDQRARDAAFAGD